MNGSPLLTSFDLPLLLSVAVVANVVAFSFVLAPAGSQLIKPISFAIDLLAALFEVAVLFADAFAPDLANDDVVISS